MKEDSPGKQRTIGGCFKATGRSFMYKSAILKSSIIDSAAQGYGQKGVMMVSLGIVGGHQG